MELVSNLRVPSKALFDLFFPFGFQGLECVSLLAYRNYAEKVINLGKRQLSIQFVAFISGSKLLFWLKVVWMFHPNWSILSSPPSGRISPISTRCTFGYTISTLTWPRPPVYYLTICTNWIYNLYPEMSTRRLKNSFNWAGPPFVFWQYSTPRLQKNRCEQYTRICLNWKSWCCMQSNSGVTIWPNGMPFV